MKTINKLTVNNINLAVKCHSRLFSICTFAYFCVIVKHHKVIAQVIKFIQNWW